MNPARRETLILTGAGLAAAATGFLVGPLLTGGEPGTSNLPDAGLVDLTGKSRRLAEWQGRVLVGNFWATWCAPCREEIPLLVDFRSRYASKGVEVVGIAIDNGPKVGEFTRSFSISYPILVAEASGLDLMRQLGNRTGALPFTIVFDRKGEPSHRKLGVLKPGELEGILAGMRVG